MSSKKHLIVLVIDDETFTQEQPDDIKMTPELLTEIGQQVNDDAASIYGYESWLVIPSVSDNLMKLIASHHVDTLGKESNNG